MCTCTEIGVSTLGRGVLPKLHYTKFFSDFRYTHIYHETCTNINLAQPPKSHALKPELNYTVFALIVHTYFTYATAHRHEM